MTSAWKYWAFTVSPASVVQAFNWDLDQGAPSAHQAVSSRQLSCDQVLNKPGSLHPISRHQYPGQEIRMHGMHHQESATDWALSQQHKWGRILPEQVMEACLANPERSSLRGCDLLHTDSTIPESALFRATLHNVFYWLLDCAPSYTTCLYLCPFPSAIHFTPNMEAARSSEILVSYCNITWHHNPKTSIWTLWMNSPSTGRPLNCFPRSGAACIKFQYCYTWLAYKYISTLLHENLPMHLQHK
jgi:hypothetical protein